MSSAGGDDDDIFGGELDNDDDSRRPYKRKRDFPSIKSTFLADNLGRSQIPSQLSEDDELSLSAGAGGGRGRLTSSTPDNIFVITIVSR